MNKLPHTFGEAVQSARKAKGWTLRDLAARVGLSASYICDVENDRRDPAAAAIEAIRTELDLAMDFDTAMALSGRIRPFAERYLRRRPLAGVLLQRLAEIDASDDVVEKMILALRVKSFVGRRR